MKEIILPVQTRKLGYTKREVLDIIKKYKIHHMTFWKKFGVNTCSIDDGQIIYYACDIITAIRCCLEKRDNTFLEWD